jgi:large subunit ribosomal protein L18
MAITHNAKIRRARRVRSKMSGTAETPRVSVFRSNVALSGQAIDDANRSTMAFVTSRNEKSGTKSEKSLAAGVKMGEALVKLGVKKAVFDRGPYLYHGRVKAFAEGLRSAGIEM